MNLLLSNYHVKEVLSVITLVMIVEFIYFDHYANQYFNRSISLRVLFPFSLLFLEDKIMSVPLAMISCKTSLFP